MKLSNNQFLISENAIAMLLALIAVAFLVSCKQDIKELTTGQVEFPTQGLVIAVEIAETTEQKARGLMFRESMDNDHGMLFIYQDEDIRSIWMKNTLISLDILFVSSSGTIVSIYQRVQPCQESPCQRYVSRHKAKYIIEVNSGLVDENKFLTGQRINIKRY